MIGAAALRKQAENKYPDVVQALLRGETPFPLRLRYPRITTTDTREAILRDVATLKGESVEKLGYGLTIEWTEINTVKYGRNTVPAGIFLATEPDFLGYVGKLDEVRTIRTAAVTLVQAFPDLQPHLPALWRLLRNGSREFWQQVVRVVRFFKESPFPDRYIRELPVEVPTKFIGENHFLIERLIGAVAPESLRSDRETFEERLGLRTADALIECRLLDDGLLPGWHFRQFTVGLRDLNHLGELPAHTVVITENRTNFLTLPSLAGTIALLGQGYAVSRLRRAPFLEAKRILYWGDLDAHGFEILAILRRAFPHVESLMMDVQTWTRFVNYRGEGVASRNPPEQFLPFLDEMEASLFKEIAAADKRLEQERIPQDYANECLAVKMAAAATPAGLLRNSGP
jgi:hypothetical protein